MGQVRAKRPPVLERRRIKHAAKEAARAREELRSRARALRDLAQKHILVNPENLAPDNSYSSPDFVTRGYYLDMPFVCKSCGAHQVWTEAQQKWWYESAKGNVWTIAIHCRPCRRREREHRAASQQGAAASKSARSRNAG